MAKRIKEKALKIAQEREKRPHAYARNIRISPSKVRVVLKHIRGKSVNDALAMLEAAPKAASPIVSKLIRSAVANAEHNLEIPRIDLFVAEIFADPGPTLKRAMARAKGRSYAILKRTSHITVILDSYKAVEAAVSPTKKEIMPAVKKETVKKEAAPAKAHAKKETANTVAPKKESVKKEAAPAKAPAKKETANTVAPKKETVKKEGADTVTANKQTKPTDGETAPLIKETAPKTAVKKAVIPAAPKEAAKKTEKAEVKKEETTIEEAK